jgi:hypothetical protein
MQGAPARLIEVCIDAKPPTIRTASVANARQVGGLVGPTLVALTITFKAYRSNQT